MAKYSVTREEIKSAALSFRGTKFVHQGRSIDGVDCVGLLVEIGRLIKYPEIFDIEGYRRTPSASVIRDMLKKNCIEIPVAKAGVGDIFLMRMFGVKPRHTSIMIEDRTDLKNGIAPQIIHANFNGVQINHISDYPAAWYVAAFRIKGLKA